MSGTNKKKSKSTASFPSWTPGAPGELLEANRPLVKILRRLIKLEEKDKVLQSIADWPANDIMELLIHLPLKAARQLYGWLPTGPASRVMAEVNPELRALLVEEASLDRIAQIAAGMDDDVAAQFVNDLPDEAVGPLLARLPRGPEISRRLGFPEDSVGFIMSNRFVAVLRKWDIGTANRQIRRRAAEIEKLYEVYVVDEDRRLVGLLKLRDLLLSPKKTVVQDVMRPVPVAVRPDADQEELLDLAQRHDVQTIPVVDEDERIVGRIEMSELQAIARREAEEDLKLMSGIAADAKADDSLRRMVISRLPWLAGGLVGSSIAATVVTSFEEDLARAVILASFIPMVMALAGNAGIQSSTVTVQGLANGTIWLGDLGNRLLREFMGAVTNGLIVAMIVGSLVMCASLFIEIDAPVRLAIATGLSMVCVTTVAATIGAVVPVVLKYLKVDPAVATGVFITTSNDVFGVLIYFTIATQIYLGSVDLA